MSRFDGKSAIHIENDGKGGIEVKTEGTSGEAVFNLAVAVYTVSKTTKLPESVILGMILSLLKGLKYNWKRHVFFDMDKIKEAMRENREDDTAW